MGKSVMARIQLQHVQSSAIQNQAVVFIGCFCRPYDCVTVSPSKAGQVFGCLENAVVALGICVIGWRVNTVSAQIKLARVSTSEEVRRKS